MVLLDHKEGNKPKRKTKERTSKMKKYYDELTYYYERSQSVSFYEARHNGTSIYIGRESTCIQRLSCYDDSYGSEDYYAECIEELYGGQIA